MCLEPNDSALRRQRDACKKRPTTCKHSIAEPQDAPVLMMAVLSRPAQRCRVSLVGRVAVHVHIT